MSVAKLLQMVADAGFVVDCTGENSRLVKTREDARITTRLVEALKRHRDEVIEYLTCCVVCGRNVSDPEDRERMIDAAHCDRGGGKAYRDQNGIEHPESQRCPHKPR
jgi:hypothetical protein